MAGMRSWRATSNLKAALGHTGAHKTFMPAISHENAQHGKRNLYYPTDEEFSIALAEALNEEYRAIMDAGLLIQIDDPQLITYFDRNPDKSIAECRKCAGGASKL
jgi:5-methyltetrahydropteroyltriglutamate--homocysteine methyltransferase